MQLKACALVSLYEWQSGTNEWIEYGNPQVAGALCFVVQEDIGEMLFQVINTQNGEAPFVCRLDSSMTYDEDSEYFYSIPGEVLLLCKLIVDIDLNEGRVGFSFSSVIEAEQFVEIVRNYLSGQKADSTTYNKTGNAALSAGKL